jgi:ubiquitin-conjugating enzyme E2 variant
MRAAACGSGRRASERAVRAGVAVAILGVIPLSLAHLFRGIRDLEPSAGLGAVAGVLLGMLAADAITGGVHWACDTWGSARTPWIGPRLIDAFREHHCDPRAICRHDWIEVNREPAIAAGLGFVLLALSPVQAWSADRPMAYAFLWSMISFGAMANQIHRWAHERRPPRPVRWLQRSGLILSGPHHARHHRAPHTRAYCIATGWLNGPLDSSGFWRALERGIRTAARAWPRRP